MKESIDGSINAILESYEKYGGINLDESNNFPNRQNVIEVLKDIEYLIFPGFRTAETLDAGTLRFIVGQRVNRIVEMLTREIKKALAYVVRNRRASL